MKTILQALIDEIHYPIPIGFVENKVIERQLDGGDFFTFEVAQSKEWKWSACRLPLFSHTGCKLI